MPAGEPLKIAVEQNVLFHSMEREVTEDTRGILSKTLFLLAPVQLFGQIIGSQAMHSPTSTIHRLTTQWCTV